MTAVLSEPALFRTPHRCARAARCANRVRTDVAVPLDDLSCPCRCHGQSFMNRMCDIEGGCGHLHNPPPLDPDAVPTFEGGAILDQSGLCEACANRVSSAIDDLPLDYTELNLLLASGESGVTDVLVSSTGDLQVPIRVSIEALQAAMVTQARWCAALVAQDLGIGWDVRACRPGWVLQRSANLLVNGFGTLLALDSLPYFDHIADDWVTRDGIDGALELLRLHDLVRFASGKTKLIHRLPSPCPRCEQLALVRYNGCEHVTCESCGVRWPESDYRRLTLVLAEDYQDADVQRERPVLVTGDEGTTGSAAGGYQPPWPALPMVEFPESA